MIKRLIQIIIFSILIVIGIYLILFLLSFITEDLSLKISPNQKAIYTYQGTIQNETFELELQTNPFCFSQCETKFIDVSKNITLSENKFEFYLWTFEKKKNITQEFMAPEYGIGQKIFNLKTRCRNILTPLCMTNSKWYEKTSLITLNYNFNPEKELMKDKAKESLILFLDSINKTDYNVQKIEDAFNQIDSKIVIGNRLNNSVVLTKINFNSFKNLGENLRDLWYEKEDYSTILQNLDENVINQVFMVENKSKENYANLLNSAVSHNQISIMANSIEDRYNSIENADSDSNETKDFLNIYLKFKRLNFSNYDEMNNLFLTKYHNLNSKFGSYVLQAYFSLNSEGAMECDLKGYCSIPEEYNLSSFNENLSEICTKIKEEKQKKINADNYFAYNYAIQNNLDIPELAQNNSYTLVYNYLNISGYLQNKKFEEETRLLYANYAKNTSNEEIKKNNIKIIELNMLISNSNQKRTITNQLISVNGSKSISLCNNLSELFNAETDIYKKTIILSKIEENCNSRIDSILSGEMGEEKNQFILLKNISLLNESDMTLFTASFPLEFEIMAINLSSGSNYLEFFSNNFCIKNYNSTNETKFNKEIITLTEFTNFFPKINITIDEPIKQCCVLGKCKPCCINQSCMNDSRTYSLVFVHGHEFNKANSPEYSLGSLNNLQNEIEKEGYINAGVIIPNSNYFEINEGEWGISGMPVTLRLSYYYNVYDENGILVNLTKSTEHIETYADRLDYMINLIKYRTGKDKINIVAHSMGGLVVREYIKKYGEQNIDKFIMIGTPNYGIKGNVDEYCPVLGGKIECEEMKENSTFLEELNKYVPENKTKFYTIIGTGCLMDGFDGDGIALSKNVPLNYSENYYIEGKCPNVLSNLHTTMLDPKEYPEVFEIIENILKSS